MNGNFTASFRNPMQIPCFLLKILLLEEKILLIIFLTLEAKNSLASQVVVQVQYCIIQEQEIYGTDS